MVLPPPPWAGTTSQVLALKQSYARQFRGVASRPDKFSGKTVMGWIIAIVALSFVMTVMVVAELRPRRVKASTVQLPELTSADRAIAVFVLAMFTLAIANGLVLMAAKTLP